MIEKNSDLVLARIESAAVHWRPFLDTSMTGTNIGGLFDRDMIFVHDAYVINVDYQLDDCREISRESRKRSRNRMSKSGSVLQILNFGQEQI